MARVPSIPTPHAEQLDRSLLLSRVKRPLNELREAHIALEPAKIGALFEEVGKLDTSAELAEVLQRLGVEKVRELIDVADEVREEVILRSDVIACNRIIRNVKALMSGSRAAFVLAELREFFSTVAGDIALEVIPYPLSSRCKVSFGSLTKKLLTLGVHPELVPEHAFGIIIHEAVHVWVAQKLAERERAELREIAEPLATAVGNGWAVQRMFKAPAVEWYDDEVIDRSARAIFPIIAMAISAGQQLESVIVSLVSTVRQIRAAPN